MAVVLEFLGEAQRSAREAPHAHPRGEAAALDVDVAHVVAVGVAGDLGLAGSNALGRAVARVALRRRQFIPL